MLRLLFAAALCALLLPSPTWSQQNTSLISQTQVGSYSESLDREGNLIAISQHEAGCVLVDASNPLSPTIVSTISPDFGSHDIWDVDIHNNYVYLMNRPDAVDSNLGNWVGMYVYDITTPSAPTLEGYLLWGNAPGHHLAGSVSAGTIQVIGNQTLAFLCSDITSGVEIFDVTVPSQPSYVASIYGPQGWSLSWDVLVQNGLLYTAWGSGGFTIHDVSSPNSPLQLIHQPYIGSPTINGGVRSITPTPNGTRVITGEYTLEGDVRLWDLNALPATQATASWRLNANSLLWTVRTTNDFAFVAHLESGVQILDLRNGQLSRVGSFDPDGATTSKTWSGISDIELDGTRVYATHDTDGLFVFDFGDEVSITKAQWHARKKELLVWATCSAQPLADLEVNGFGMMTWNSKRNRYELKLRGVNSNPGVVMVESSLTGVDISPVTSR